MLGDRFPVTILFGMDKIYYSWTEVNQYHCWQPRYRKGIESPDLPKDPSLKAGSTGRGALGLLSPAALRFRPLPPILFKARIGRYLLRGKPWISGT